MATNQTINQPKPESLVECVLREWREERINNTTSVAGPSSTATDNKATLENARLSESMPIGETEMEKQHQGDGRPIENDRPLSQTLRRSGRFRMPPQRFHDQFFETPRAARTTKPKATSTTPGKAGAHDGTVVHGGPSVAAAASTQAATKTVATTNSHSTPSTDNSSRPHSSLSPSAVASIDSSVTAANSKVVPKLYPSKHNTSTTTINPEIITKPVAKKSVIPEDVNPTIAAHNLSTTPQCSMPASLVASSGNIAQNNNPSITAKPLRTVLKLVVTKSNIPQINSSPMPATAPKQVIKLSVTKSNIPQVNNPVVVFPATTPKQVLKLSVTKQVSPLINNPVITATTPQEPIEPVLMMRKREDEESGQEIETNNQSREKNSQDQLTQAGGNGNDTGGTNAKKDEDNLNNEGNPLAEKPRPIKKIRIVGPYSLKTE